LGSTSRYCLWLKEFPLEELWLDPFIAERLKRVRDFRNKSKKEATRRASETPHLFDEDRQQNSGTFILLPYTTSERRTYLPMSFKTSDTVISNLANMVIDGDLFDLGVLSSRMCLDWMRAVGGRLENRVRFSGQLVYNTFPWPQASAENIEHIKELSEEILLVREDYPEKSLSQLYDPDEMPPQLHKAHENLDRAVEKLYREKPFRDTPERLEHLFALYEKLTAEEKEKKSSRKTVRGSK
jgi:hypothetical protein